MLKIALSKNLLLVAVLAGAVAALQCAGSPPSESTDEGLAVEGSAAAESAPEPTEAAPEPTEAPASPPHAGATATEDDQQSATPEAEERALSFDPTKATGAVVGVPDPGNTASITAVANFYTELPGIDTSGLTQAQMEKFLIRANSELCTCGCKHTLAHCYINDAKCPDAKGLLLKVLEEVKSGS